jgi:hypothetical protein
MAGGAVLDVPASLCAGKGYSGALRPLHRFNFLDDPAPVDLRRAP